MTKSDIVTELGFLQINHFGEELCGDHVEIATNPHTKILVLADGLGSGVKANILSILTSKTLATMMNNDVNMDEILETIAETLPVCKERGVAYSTFTAIKVTDDKYVEIYNYDNPLPFVLRNGKHLDLAYSSTIHKGKNIDHTSFTAECFDTIYAMSDGIIHAGIGSSLNFGWELPEVIDYASHTYLETFSAKSLSTILVSHVNDLYASKPGDDCTCAVVRFRDKKYANLMIGPASVREDDDSMISSFINSQGKHIVSGGTTSHIVSKYLNKPILLSMDYEDKDIPPTAKIEGLDLVTEGIITINRVLEYAQNVLCDNSKYFDWCYRSDGASEIARILFEEATDINFFVGCAINPAHQAEGLPINFKTKMQLIDSLAIALRKMGKNVKVRYY